MIGKFAAFAIVVASSYVADIASDVFRHYFLEDIPQEFIHFESIEMDNEHEHP
jgi:hypothetical protein